MEKAFQEVGDQFAEKIIRGEFDAARSLLAPWLESAISAKQLETIVREGQGKQPAPAEFELDSNSCELEDLEVDENSPPTHALPAEITKANFRQWMVIQFNDSFDLWMALVEVSGALKIGYLEAASAN
ncbi:MAG TPA: hypothetical protein VKG84_03415 [Candidatus Acidoferrales bacterium]|nr:hypothetical protein [Candidatus Acidoferrales bacterium]